MRSHRHSKAARTACWGTCLFIVGAGCSKEPTPASLRTAEVEKRDIKATVDATGRLEALDPIDIVPAIDGALAAVRVKPGDRVKAGQELALLDSELAQSRVTMQRAALAASQGQERLAVLDVQACNRKLARSERLVERGQLSAAELEEIRHQCREAQTKREIAGAERERAAASLAAAEREVEHSIIRAPKDGVVLFAPSHLGAWTNPKSPLFRIGAPLDHLVIEARVAEVDIHKLELGQTCSFEVEAYPGRAFSAEITNLGVNAEPDEGSVTYAVNLRAANPDEALRPGMSARVRFVIADVKNVLAAREAALRFEPEGAEEAAPQSRVFKRIGPNELEEIKVEAGVSDGKFVELRQANGLEAGDRLVTGYTDARGPIGPAVRISGP